MLPGPPPAPPQRPGIQHLLTLNVPGAGAAQAQSSRGFWGAAVLGWLCPLGGDPVGCSWDRGLPAALPLAGAGAAKPDSAAPPRAISGVYLNFLQPLRTLLFLPGDGSVTLERSHRAGSVSSACTYAPFLKNGLGAGPPPRLGFK